MTAITLIGTGAAPALATDYGYGENGGDGNSISTSIDRSNNIEQEQEACTNEVDVEAGDDQTALVDADQTNDCVVNQNQGAAILDFSDFEFELDAIIAG